MRLKPAILVTTALLAIGAPAFAQPAQAQDPSRLAHRLVDDLAGGSDFATTFTQTVLIGFDTVAQSGLVRDPAGHRAALEQALSENRPVMTELENRLAGVYAADLSPQEMSGWIAFLESPAGQAIQLKKLQAGPLGHPDLTAAEVEAQNGFETTDIGRSIAAKNGAMLGETIKLTSEFNTALAARAQAIYCDASGTCAAQ